MPKGFTTLIRTCPNCGKSGRPSSIGTHIRTCGKEDELLWARITKAGQDDCWVYRGAVDQHGYGRPGRLHGRYYAHRRIYEITFGSIPDGLQVLHKCDNRPCCNPAHLFLGSIQDNAIDKLRKGRDHAASLKPDQVRAIRDALQKPYRGLQRDLARQYGVKPCVINNINMGDTYQWVK